MADVFEMLGIAPSAPEPMPESAREPADVFEMLGIKPDSKSNTLLSRGLRTADLAKRGVAPAGRVVMPYEGPTYDLLPGQQPPTRIPSAELDFQEAMAAEAQRQSDEGGLGRAAAAGAISGIEHTVEGLANAVPLAVDAVTGAIVNPLIAAAQGKPDRFSPYIGPPMTDEQARNYYKPAIGLMPRAKLPSKMSEQIPKPAAAKKAWDDLKDGERMTWLVSNVAEQAPQAAGFVATLFNPAFSSAFLGSMGAMSAGNSYAEAVDKGLDPKRAAVAAWVDGGIEVLSEKLPLDVAHKLRKYIKAMPVEKGAAFVGEAIKRAGIGAAMLGVQAGTESAEEGVAQVGQNLSRRYIAGDKTVEWDDGIKDAMILGAAGGAVMGTPNAVLAVTRRGEDEPIAIPETKNDMLDAIIQQGQGKAVTPEMAQPTPKPKPNQTHKLKPPADTAGKASGIVDRDTGEIVPLASSDTAGLVRDPVSGERVPPDQARKPGVIGDPLGLNPAVKDSLTVGDSAATTAGVPVMITKKMGNRLLDLGYSAKEIRILTPQQARTLTPQQAHDLIGAGISKPSATLPNAETPPSNNTPHATESVPPEPTQAHPEGLLSPMGKDAPAAQASVTATPEPAQAQTERPLFTPTHEASDGTPVVPAEGQPGVWVDATGMEIEDQYATPISKHKPGRIQNEKSLQPQVEAAPKNEPATGGNDAPVHPVQGESAQQNKQPVTPSQNTDVYNPPENQDKKFTIRQHGKKSVVIEGVTKEDLATVQQRLKDAGVTQKGIHYPKSNVLHLDRVHEKGIRQALEAANEINDSTAISNPPETARVSITPPIKMAEGDVAGGKTDTQGAVPSNRVGVSNGAAELVGGDSLTSGKLEGREQDAVPQPDTALRDKIAKRYSDAIAQKTGTPASDSPRQLYYDFADSIFNKDGYALEYLANGMNDVGKAIFSEVTGVKLPKQLNKTWEAIRDWAGITPEQDAAKRAAKNERRAQEGVEAGLKWQATSAAQLKMPGGLNGKEWVEKAVADGFDKLVPHKTGAKTDYWLTNAEGKGYHLTKKGSGAAPLWKYAKAYLDQRGVEKTEQQSDEAGSLLNDRDHFTLERVNNDADGLEVITFSRGERIKIAGSFPMRSGEIAGISQAERKFRISGSDVWYDFGYAYKQAYNEAAYPREVVEKAIDHLESRLNEGNAIEANDLLRDIIKQAKHFGLTQHDDDVSRLRRKIVAVERSNEELRTQENTRKESEYKKRQESGQDQRDASDTIRMTMEEWKATHMDFKARLPDGTRSVIRNGAMRTVEIVKEKQQEPEVEKAKEALKTAGVTGKELREAIKDVRKGDLTADEVVESVKTAAKIEDFGEKIGGAKKDVYALYKDKLKQAEGEDIAAVPLSKSWPEPGYQSLLDDGVDPWAVGFAHAARDEIPVKPKVNWKRKQWIGQVEMLRDLTFKIMNGEISIARAQEKLIEMAEISRGLNDIGNRVEMYQLVGHSKSLKGMRLSSGEYSIYSGVEYKPAKVIWTVSMEAKASAFSNWPRELAMGYTKQEAMQAFKDKFDSMEIDKPAKREVSFSIYSKIGGNAFYIGKKVGRNYIDLEKFESIKEARAYMQDHHDELAAKLEKVKELPAVRRDTNNPRVGEDMRGGQDVTPELFAETFGFRGVEFGNWVDAKKRQNDLNESFDALMDMAAVLEVPAKALSLNGELGLAFGARGSGGVDPAKAHYERGHVVINLTKKDGAGSLGHEWWHALDNYFSRIRSKRGEMMTEAQDVARSSTHGNYTHIGEVRKEMIDAFGLIVKSVNQTALKARSGKLDSRRSKDYWTTKPEMTARSFETYLIAKLHDQNASNDYLANIVTEETWKAAESLGWELDSSYPYPTAAEIPAIRASFDHFFNTVQTKETEKGVAMLSFSASGQNLSPLSIGVADRVVARILAEKSWNVDLRTVATFDALPVDAKEAVAEYGEDGSSGKVQGVLHKGVLHVVADAHGSEAELEATILHEMVGHIGVRRLYGRETTAKLNQLFLQIGGLKGMREIAAKRGVGKDLEWYVARVKESAFPDEMRVRIMMEETLAHIAQEPKFTDKVKAIVGAIRAWLRDHGFARLAEYGETDLLHILSMGEKALKTVKTADGPAVLMVAWHGTPHSFSEFKTENIGTGEGAQAFGWGLYFAGDKEVAEYYRDTLSRSKYGAQVLQDGRNNYSVWILKRGAEQISLLDSGLLYGQAKKMADKYDADNKGRLYRVELAPREDEYLLWHKPLSEQSEKVRVALKNAGIEEAVTRPHPDGFDVEAQVDGEEAYNNLVLGFSKDKSAGDVEGDRAASEYLHSIGIRGIKYLDGSSRGDGDGSYNYVIFNEDDISITANYAIRKPARNRENIVHSDRLTHPGIAPIKGTVAGVRQVIASTVLSWGQNAPDVQVVQSIKDLPAHLRPERSVSLFGVHDPSSGVVYLIADNLGRTVDVRTILAHEAIGHYAMEEMLGDALMADAVKRVQWLKDAGDKTILAVADEVAQDYGRLDSTTESKEIIAKLAERRELKSKFAKLYESIMSAMRKFLRKIGFNVMFSNKDIDAILADAERWIKQDGGKRTQRNEALWHRQLGEIDLVMGDGGAYGASRWVAAHPEVGADIGQLVANAELIKETSTQATLKNGAVTFDLIKRGERWRLTDANVGVNYAKRGDKIGGMSSNDGAGDNLTKNTPQAPESEGVPITNVERGFTILPVEVVVDSSVVGAKVDIFPKGHIRLSWKGFGLTPGELKELVYDAVIARFDIKNDDVNFWRFTNNKNEPTLAKNKELRASRNHAENTIEKGISVAAGAHYAIHGYKYGYQLTGDVIGAGSDGEPLLDPRSISVISSIKNVADIISADRKNINNYRDKELKKLGWSIEQYKAAISGIERLGTEDYLKRLPINNLPQRTQGAEKDSQAPVDAGVPASGSEKSPNYAIRKTADGKPDHYALNPDNDSLLQSIAKRGGISAAEAERVGIPKGVGGRSGVFGKPFVRAKGGLPFDDIVRHLVKSGYIPKGTADAHALVLDKITTELQGEKSYTKQGAIAAGNRKRMGMKSADPKSAQQFIDELAMTVPTRESLTTRIKESIGGKLADMNKEGEWLRFMTRQHLAEWGERWLPHLRTFENLARDMDAARNERIVEAAEIAKPMGEWARKQQADYKAMSALAHEATIEGVDPSEPFTLIIGKAEGKQKIKTLKEQARLSPGEAYKYVNQINEITAQMHADVRREAAYPGLVAKWDGLTPEAQRYYIRVRDAYSKRLLETEEALAGIADRAMISDNERRVMKTKIREHFESMRVQGPYFPLSRPGDYWVEATMGDPESVDYKRVVLPFEKYAEMQQAVKKLKLAGWDVRQGEKIQKVKALGGASEAFVDDVISLLDGKVGQAVRDDIYQLWLTTMPELSMRKHFIHRNKVEGYDDDMIRAFADNMFHGAYQIAKMEYADRLADLLKKMDDAVETSENPTKAGRYFAEIQKRYEWLLNPQAAAWTSHANSLGFAYYLGLTPAAALVNATQTPLIAFPVLGARFGFAKAAKALAKANNEFFRGMHKKGAKDNIKEGMFSLENKLAGQELDYFKRFQRAGGIDKTMTHDLIGQAESISTIYTGTAAKAQAVIGYGFHHVERYNREITFVAAFRMSMQKHGNAERAYFEAADLTWKAHYDYSNANKARFMQGNIARVAFMFRQYSLNTTMLLVRSTRDMLKGESKEVRKEGAKQLAGILVMTQLAAGALGLPSVWDIMELAFQALFGDDDDPEELQTVFINFLSDHLPETAVKALGFGLGNAVGVDLHSRVGLNNLWLREGGGESLDGGELFMYKAAQLTLGPMGGIGANVAEGVSLINDGKMYLGIERMMPKAFRDVMKAYRYADEGVTNRRGDTIVNDIHPGEISLQAIGFTPGDIAFRYEANRALNNRIYGVLDRRQHLMNRYLQAQSAGDQSAIDEWGDAINTFNEKNPENGITDRNIRQSQQGRDRRTGSAVNGIYYNRNSQHFQDDVRFGGE